MALDRAASSPQPEPQRSGASSAGFQRYEEAVFCVTADGRIEPANPVATEYAARL